MSVPVNVPCPICLSLADVVSRPFPDFIGEFSHPVVAISPSVMALQSAICVRFTHKPNEDPQPEAQPKFYSPFLDNIHTFADTSRSQIPDVGYSWSLGLIVAPTCAQSGLEDLCVS